MVTLRRKSDAVGLAAGLIVFAVSGAIAARGMVVGEAGLFVAINSLTDWFYYAIWPFMQFGVFLTIPILVVIALVMRRMRLAAAMAIGRLVAARHVSGFGPREGSDLHYFEKHAGAVPDVAAAWVRANRNRSRVGSVLRGN